MKTAIERRGIPLPEINHRRLKRTLRAHRLRALAIARALAYLALEAPGLEREQGPGMPTLSEHEWRPTRIIS